MSGSRLLRKIVPQLRLCVREGHAAAIEPSKIGAREVVGFGYNGEPNYMDRLDFPFPAVRFRQDTPDLKVVSSVYLSSADFGVIQNSAGSALVLEWLNLSYLSLLIFNSPLKLDVVQTVAGSHIFKFRKMLSARIFNLRALRRASSIAPDYRHKIGDREIVGHGYNSLPYYMDRLDFPFPAIRFKPDTADIKALREKEKGDWRNLTIEEKKALYRASFRQTFAEFDAPTGEWKSVLGFGLVFASLGLWLHMLVKYIAYDPKTLPDSLSEESRTAQLKRILAFRINPIDGPASKYDYENNTWKK